MPFARLAPRNRSDHDANDRVAGSRPRSARQGRARVSDARLWGGVLLLVVATSAGAVLLGRGVDTVLVLQADRDLSTGATLDSTSSIAVPVWLADGYVTASDDVDGRLRWPVSAGELVPRSAVVQQDEAPMRGVTVEVDPAHAPARLAPGDLVDVWATSSDLSGATAVAPRLVLEAVQVSTVTTDAVGFGGGWGVELSVPPDAVSDVVAAARGGVLDLVTVPLASQQVLP